MAAVAGLLMLLPWPVALLLCFIGKFIVPFAAGAVASRFLRGLVIGRVGLLRLSDVAAGVGPLAQVTVDTVEVKFAVVRGRRMPAPSLHVGKVAVLVSLPAPPRRGSVAPVGPATVGGDAGSSGGVAAQQPTPAPARFMAGLPPPLPPPPGMDMAGRHGTCVSVCVRVLAPIIAVVCLRQGGLARMMAARARRREGASVTPRVVCCGRSCLVVGV